MSQQNWVIKFFKTFFAFEQEKIIFNDLLLFIIITLLQCILSFIQVPSLTKNKKFIVNSSPINVWHAFIFYVT